MKAINQNLELTPMGLYCSAGDFYIDPRRPVKRAIITHGHADHARWGSESYLCTQESKGLLQVRLGSDAKIKAMACGEVRTINGLRLSLHSAGHILGSAQVRIERSVRPVLAFEIAFEGIQPSTRHKSGVAVRFPRIHRWRHDKTVAEIDTMDGLKALLPG